VNDRDIDGYLACCTEDIQLQNPMTALEGIYKGSEGIKRFFADIHDAGPDFRVTIDRLESVGADRVVGFLRLNMSGRASGITLGGDIPATNVYDLADGKISRIRIFLDRAEALEAVGGSENLKRARAAFDAYNRDGPESFFDQLDPSIVWIADRADAGRVTSRGIDGVRRSFREQFEAVSNLQFHVGEMQEAGDRIVALGRLSGRFRATGIEGEIPFGMVLTFGPNGKLVRYESFRDTSQALRTVGLSQQDG
jgi:ketosteroid isomerase-like protein